jgi:hypothetical protein
MGLVKLKFPLPPKTLVLIAAGRTTEAAQSNRHSPDAGFDFLEPESFAGRGEIALRLRVFALVSAQSW